MVGTAPGGACSRFCHPSQSIYSSSSIHSLFHLGPRDPEIVLTRCKTCGRAARITAPFFPLSTFPTPRRSITFDWSAREGESTLCFFLLKTLPVKFSRSAARISIKAGCWGKSPLSATSSRADFPLLTRSWITSFDDEIILRLLVQMSAPLTYCRICTS